MATTPPPPTSRTPAPTPSVNVAELVSDEDVLLALNHVDSALAGLRIEILHGRLPADEKDAVMRDFAAGAIDVLVSTTVIEVGVDVPNATVMVVMDADRFGISQLHQLRGRIGRGGHPGTCLLVTGAEPGPAQERLEAVERRFAAGGLDIDRPYLAPGPVAAHVL